MTSVRTCFALSILVTGLFFGLFFGLTATAAIEKKPLVFVKKAELSELSELLTYPARVEPRIRATVVAEADGVIAKIIAPLGSVVKAGTRLAVIRNTDPVYRYAPLYVTAPVPGIVSQVDVSEGSRVSRGDKIALVTDPSQARVTVEVTADDIKSVRPGLEAELRLSDGEKLKLRVRGLSPFVDPSTGTATCELELADAKSGQLPPPGVVARVVFKANVRNGISLPDSVITYRGKDPYVRIVDAGKAKLVAVVIGRKQAGEVEILKGLKAGDVVVERTSKFVADGEDVEIQDKSAETAKPTT
ncbi:MAG: efflux RND transporter periplasmic adaptor subunit [Bdellovibrionota bacterium]